MRDLKIVERPFTKTIKWCNEKFNTRTKNVEREKGWYYYVPSEVEGEKGTNIRLKEPFSFMWLTDAMSISGFNEKEQKSVYSNEVLGGKALESVLPRLTGESIDIYKKRLEKAATMTVKIGKDVIATGLYKDIKDKVTSKEVGGKFCNAVYALLALSKGEYEVVRILMTGSSFSSWLNVKKNDIVKNAIIYSGETIPKEKGTVSYDEPVLKVDKSTSKEFLSEADKYFVGVKDYFKYILSESSSVEEVVTDAPLVAEFDEDGNELPF